MKTIRKAPFRNIHYGEACDGDALWIQLEFLGELGDRVFFTRAEALELACGILETMEIDEEKEEENS